MKNRLVVALFAVGALTSLAPGAALASEPPTNLPEGSDLRIANSFAFEADQPRQSFQDGAPRRDAAIDQERPFCTFALKTADAAEPRFRVGEIIRITAAVRKVTGGLAAEIYRLQFDKRVNLLICWGVGAAYPSLEQIRESLGSYVELPR